MGEPDRPTLGDIGDLVTAREAAAATRTHIDTIRRAIRKGELKAVAPRGRAPQQLGGAGGGYRIHKAELERWWFSLGPQEAQS